MLDDEVVVELQQLFVDYDATDDEIDEYCVRTDVMRLLVEVVDDELESDVQIVDINDDAELVE